jgi:hypothetical protein
MTMVLNAARMHCATPRTPLLAIPTQAADSGRIRPEVCRFLILKSYIRLRVLT